jgi:hypothetical protein
MTLYPFVRLGKTPRSGQNFFPFPLKSNPFDSALKVITLQSKLRCRWICYEREEVRYYNTPTPYFFYAPPLLPPRTYHILKVGESLVVKDALRHYAREGEHRRPAVSDLLELHALDFRGALAIEEALPETEVSRGASGSLQHLGNADPTRHLGEGDPNEYVPEGAVLDGGTVGGGARGRGHGLRITRHSHAEVDGDVTEPRELAHTSVLELGLAQVVDGEVVRYAKGVEADVADVSLAVGGCGEEGQGLRLGVQARDGSAWVGGDVMICVDGGSVMSDDVRSEFILMEGDREK